MSSKLFQSKQPGWLKGFLGLTLALVLMVTLSIFINFQPAKTESVSQNSKQTDSWSNLASLTLTPLPRFPDDSVKSPPFPEKLLAQIKEMLPSLFSIAEAAPNAFGMGPDSSPQKAKLGKPFLVYELTSDKAAAAKSDSDLLSALTATGEWYIPIDWGNGPGALICMRYKNGDWNFAGVGGSKTWTALKAALLACNVEIPFDENEGNMANFYFVHAYEKATQLLLISKDSGLVGISLNSLAERGEINPKEASTLVSPALSVVRSVFELP